MNFLDFIIIAVLFTVNKGDKLKFRANDEIDDATNFILQSGYPAEQHTVETTDGFLLTLHRIPHGRTSNETGIPCLLLHGLFVSSASWFIMEEDSPGYILAEEGYDVWMANFRGNQFTSHRKYTDKDSEFWDFSAEEMADIDCPEIIDYVLKETGYSKLLVVASSMGTTTAFGALSANPAYNEKIAGLIAIGPIVSANYSTSVIPPLHSNFVKYGLMAINFFGNHGIRTLSSMEWSIVDYLCPMDNKDLNLCIFIGYLYNGYDPYSWSEEMVKKVNVKLAFGGVSIKNLIHIYQITTGKRNLARFDYGHRENMRKYKSTLPPELGVEDITVPVALFHGANDAMANPLDIAALARRLKNLKGEEILAFPLANHIDEIITPNIRESIMNKVMDYLKVMWQS